MRQTEIAHHRENRQWAVLLRPSLVAVTLGSVFGCILLSVGSVFGCVLLCLRSVFSRILVLSLYWTRCYQARESKTEHAISHENIKSHFCLSLFERAYCWLLLLYG